MNVSAQEISQQRIKMLDYLAASPVGGAVFVEDSIKFSVFYNLWNFRFTSEG